MQAPSMLLTPVLCTGRVSSGQAAAAGLSVLVCVQEAVPRASLQSSRWPSASEDELGQAVSTLSRLGLHGPRPHSAGSKPAALQSQTSLHRESCFKAQLECCKCKQKVTPSSFDPGKEAQACA